MKTKPPKTNRSFRPHGLSDRIVWMTVLFDAFFLILVMAILAFVYVERLNAEREDKAVLLAQDSFAAAATFYEETAADAERLALDEDVIAYLQYLQGGGDPVITDELDPDYLTYSRFSTTLKAYWESSDSLYDFIFAASTVTCTGSGGGCFVGVDGVTSDPDWRITERPWYQKASLSDSLTVSDPYVDALSGEYVLTFAVPVKENTTVLGYLGIDIRLSSLGNVIAQYDRFSAEGEKDLLVFLENGSILYSSDASRAGYVMASAAEIAALDRAAGYPDSGFASVLSGYAAGGTAQTATLFGADDYLVYGEVEGLWRLAVLLPRTRGLALELTFAVLVGTVFLLMAAVSLILGRQIRQTLSPIGDILGSIEEIKKGNFDVQVKVRENNELKHVADAINLMSKEIGSQMDLVYKSFLYDSITGLKNRRACHQDIESKLLTGTEKTAICLIDVDNLKNINVTKGQSVGDELLAAFAKSLKTVLNDSENVFANGGNEFIFILPKVKALEMVEKELLKVFERFREPIAIKNIKVEVRCSIGVAIYPYDGRKMDELIKKCDTALFKAKQAGNGKFVFYNDQITREVNYKSQINEQLAESIEKGQLYLKYQPLVDNKNEIYGFEALARWNSPTLGEISPQIFIANAEESHLIIPIGTWILRQACLSQVAMSKHFQRQFVMSVNVSPVQILQKDFPDILRKVVVETDIDPHYLVLEITEGVLIDSTIYLEETINYIHEIGAKIALDDFGTGYASLTYLRKLPFDNLKIDKSFVDGIFTSKKDHSIIGTIVQLVHNLNMTVIAEGVETRKQYEFLKQITTDVFQGFLFSQALDLEAAERYVDQFYKVNKMKRIDVFAAKDYVE